MDEELDFLAGMPRHGFLCLPDMACLVQNKWPVGQSPILSAGPDPNYPLETLKR